MCKKSADTATLVPTRHREPKRKRFRSAKRGHTQTASFSGAGAPSEHHMQTYSVGCGRSGTHYKAWSANGLLHHSTFLHSHSVPVLVAKLLISSQSFSGTNSQQWPRTTESVATATAQQAPAPRRMAASAATATAPQEPAQRRTEASAATATALLEPAPRNRFPLCHLMASPWRLCF